jgi:hypothetical protein
MKVSPVMILGRSHNEKASRMELEQRFLNSWIHYKSPAKVFERRTSRLQFSTKTSTRMLPPILFASDHLISNDFLPRVASFSAQPQNLENHSVVCLCEVLHVETTTFPTHSQPINQWRSILSDSVSRPSVSMRSDCTYVCLWLPVIPKGIKKSCSPFLIP